MKQAKVIGRVFCSRQCCGMESKTLLLVEDNTEMARLLRRQLASADQSYRVFYAATGQDALAFMCEHRPDLVLLDQDLFAVADDALPAVKPSLTMCDGRIVHRTV